MSERSSLLIVRTWQGETTLKNAGAYVTHLKTAVLPELRNIAGHQDTYILRRDLDDRVEFAVLTMWDSMDAIRQFAGEASDVAVIPPEARALLSRFDSTVKHYQAIR